MESPSIAKRKRMSQKGWPLVVEELWRVVGDSLDAFTPGECANYFAATGYDAW